MKTRMLKASGSGRHRSIAAAGRLLRKGEIVAFPTETVYGLGAGIFIRDAIRNIYRVKGRPSDNPLIVHIGTIGAVHFLATSIPIRFWILAEAFMPGPLTVVLKRSAGVPAFLNPGLRTVAVRMPDHSVARALIREAGMPVVAPSANLSGRPSPTRAAHVRQDLDGRIAAILDGGRCRVGLESTVIDLTRPIPAILRPGMITREELEDTLRTHVSVARQGGHRPRAPGMKYRHYAPKAELVVVEGPVAGVRQAMKEMVSVFGETRKIGILGEDRICRSFREIPTYSLGATGVSGAGQRLFEGLRTFDRENVDLILCQGFDEKGIGAAVMNRLNKASSRRILV